ncbi:MAG TPA: hypothetical protein GX707_20965 [Epulopiscium sp.]|nr:hypothetical protein [Candidatus Epulonipiscium sp.]
MSKKEVEIWKDIPEYEGCYQASNLGRIRSLDRIVVDSRGGERFYRGGVMNGSVNKGYRQTTLRINGIGRNFMFSQIIAMTFLGHKPDGHTLVVDHINGDRSDNRVSNLRIVTNRANTTICFRSNEESFSSEYAGVNWHENVSKWRSQIQHRGVKTHLGYYDTELEASNAYQSALSKIKDGSFSPSDYKPKCTSKYKGVYFNKSSNKWQAHIRINGKNKYLGLFKTELLAHNAYQNALKDIITQTTLANSK